MIHFQYYQPSKNEHPATINGFDYFSKQLKYEPITNEARALKQQLISYVAKVKPGRTYQVIVTIKALAAASPCFLYGNQRQLQGVANLKKGEEKQFIFYSSVSATIPFESQKRYDLDRLFVTCCVNESKNVQIICQASEVKVRKIYLCGDSTMANQVANHTFYPAMTYSSWGQTLSAFLASPIAIDNQATSGNTTESFRTQGHFALVEEFIQPGDFCFFQFGHNDQKLVHLLPHREYRQNILAYIAKIKEKGGLPILVTPLGRNTWKGQEAYLDLLSDYQQMLVQIGRTEKIPVIDLHQISVDYWKKLGLKASTDYFPKNDYTHTNEYGSYQVAQWMAVCLSKLYPDVIQLKDCPPLEPLQNAWDQFQEVGAQSQPATTSQLHQMESAIETLIGLIEEVRKNDDHLNAKIKK